MQFDISHGGSGAGTGMAGLERGSPVPVLKQAFRILLDPPMPHPDD